MNKERLLKLAGHLEHPEKWSEKKFKFGDGNFDPLSKCQDIFGEEWEEAYKNFNEHGLAKDFFNLPDIAINHLFIPYGQYPDWYGGEMLDRLATASQAANNIREFVKIMEEAIKKMKEKMRNKNL